MKGAGIDVSRKVVTWVIRHDDRMGKLRAFTNTPLGHAALINCLRKTPVGRVGSEVTGRYHRDLALALDEA